MPLLLQIIAGCLTIACLAGFVWFMGRAWRSGAEEAREFEREERRERGLCPYCGYDLRASTGICPECGAPDRPAEPDEPMTQLSSDSRLSVKRRMHADDVRAVYSPTRPQPAQPTGRRAAGDAAQPERPSRKDAEHRSILDADCPRHRIPR